MRSARAIHGRAVEKNRLAIQSAGNGHQVAAGGKGGDSDSIGISENYPLQVSRDELTGYDRIFRIADIEQQNLGSDRRWLVGLDGDARLWIRDRLARRIHRDGQHVAYRLHASRVLIDALEDAARTVAGHQAGPSGWVRVSHLAPHEGEKNRGPVLRGRFGVIDVHSLAQPVAAQPLAILVP